MLSAPGEADAEMPPETEPLIVAADPSRERRHRRPRWIGIACAAVLTAGVAVVSARVEGRDPSLPPAIGRAVSDGKTEARPGIDLPVDVAGAPVRILSATRQASYEMGRTSYGDEYRPRDPGDELLVVEYESTSAIDGDGDGDGEGVKVEPIVVDELGRRSTPGITFWSFGASESKRGWVFAVSSSAHRFTVHLGSAVPIDVSPLVTRKVEPGRA